MRRTLAVAAGFGLIASAFVAATRVTDTRAGLIAEIITLLAGLGGVAVLLYGLVPRRDPSPRVAATKTTPTGATGPRTANDLLVGGSGLAVAAILVGGLLWSGGWQWALVGAVLLLPMIAGCSYLVARFARAPERDWRIDLRRLTSSRS